MLAMQTSFMSIIKRGDHLQKLSNIRTKVFIILNQKKLRCIHLFLCKKSELSRRDVSRYLHITLIAASRLLDDLVLRGSLSVVKGRKGGGPNQYTLKEGDPINDIIYAFITGISSQTIELQADKDFIKTIDRCF